MPILVPTPKTAGGGGGGGSSNFSDLPYETLDINNGWTLPTKSGFAFNAATYDANGVGSYTFSGTAPSGYPGMPVAYRQAYAFNASGAKTLLTTADNFRIDIRLSNFQDTNGIDQKLGHTLAFGISNDPTSSNGSTFGYCGLNVLKNGNQGIKAETGAPNSAGTYTSTNVRSHYGSVQITDGQIIDVKGIALDASDNFIATTQRNANTSTSGYTLAAGPAYFCFWLFPFANFVGAYAGEASQIKVEFRAIKYEDLTP